MPIKSYVDADGVLATFDPASSLKMSEIKSEFSGDSTPSLGEYFREGDKVRSHDFLHTYKGAYYLGFYAVINSSNSAKMDIKYHIPGVTAAGEITTLSAQSVQPGGTLTYGDNSQYQFKISTGFMDGSSTRYGIKLRIVKNIGIPTKASGKPVPISFSDFYGTEKATAVPLDAEKLTIDVPYNQGKPYDGYNLKDELERYSAWDDPNVIVSEVVLNINDGRVLGSTNTSVAGLTIADLPEQLKVTVNIKAGACIYGCGGAGGDAPPSDPRSNTASMTMAKGKNGGPAIKIDHPVGKFYLNIQNSVAANKNTFQILGGGGGGSAGYTNKSTTAYGSGGGGGAGGGKGGSARNGTSIYGMGVGPVVHGSNGKWQGREGVTSRDLIGAGRDEAYLVEPKESTCGGAGGSIVRNLKRNGLVDWRYSGLTTTNGQTVEQVLNAFKGGSWTKSKISAGNSKNVTVPNLSGSAWVKHNLYGSTYRHFAIVDGVIRYADTEYEHNFSFTASGTSGYRQRYLSQLTASYVKADVQMNYKFLEYPLVRENVSFTPTSYTTDYTVSTGANGGLIPYGNTAIPLGIGKNYWSAPTAVELAIDYSNIDWSNFDFSNISSTSIGLTNLNHISDENLKQNINNVSGALDKVCSLDGVTFNYKHDDKESAGVIAQQVEKVLPSAVLINNTGDEEYKTVEYHQLSALFIESIKELKAENEELRLMIKDLKEK